MTSAERFVVVLNLVWLLAVWWGTPWFSDTVSKARLLGVSILVSGVLQLLVQFQELLQQEYRLLL